MGAIPPHAFIRRLRQLDREAFVAFVADLWAASGWETRIEDGVVVAGHGDERQRLAVAPPRPLLGWWRSGTVPEDADAVVRAGLRGRSIPGRQSIGVSEGTTIVDATELRERLLFGIDPAAADWLCVEHLGVAARSARWSDDGPLPGSRRISGGIGSHARGRTVLVGAVVISLLLFVVGPATLLTAAPVAVGPPPGDPTGDANIAVPEQTCQRGPGEVATTVSNALAPSEEGASGMQVLWEFTDPELREDRDFRAFREFYGGPEYDSLRETDVVVLEGVVRDPGQARAFVTAPTDTATTTYVFDLRERDRGGESCWTIHSVAPSGSS